MQKAFQVLKQIKKCGFNFVCEHYALWIISSMF